MSFEAKDYAINEILTKSVFEIPRNQRRYVWGTDHWNDLFEDIKFSIEQNKPHFLGSIVLEEIERNKEGLSYYTIIDGQQRLTTIVLMLVALMKHFNEMGMSDDFLGTVSYIQSKNTRNQDKVILNSDYHTSLAKFIQKIINMEDSQMTISAFVESNMLSKKRDKPIGDALKKFYSLIKSDLESVEDKEEHLRILRDAVLNMTVVRIVSSSDEDAYTIFEILNARGQELESHELLKNYIMRYILPIERRDDAKSKWEEMEHNLSTAMNKFVKHYSTHRFGDTRNKYKSAYEAIQKITRGQDISALFDDIKLKSEYYYKIIHPSRQDDLCTDEEFFIFEFFRVKRFEQFRPVLMSLIHQKELGNLTAEKYHNSLQYIYSFFVCYTIIGEERSNKLEDVVLKYARLLEDDYSDELLAEFANNLKAKLPSKEAFFNAFKNVGWSNHHDFYKGEKNKNRARIVLEIIEKYLSNQNVIPEFTIEHMQPDSASIASAQIGNLIPLEENLNGRCEDKKFKRNYPFMEHLILKQQEICPND